MRPFLFLAVALFSALLFSTPGDVRAQQGRFDAYYETQEYYDMKREEARQEEREWDRAQEQKWRDAAFACSGCVRRVEGIQVHEIYGTGLIAVLHDIDLEDAFLMVRLRFYNDGSEPASIVIAPAGYESIFILAGGQKLSILKEADGDLAAKQRLVLEVLPGAMESWWAMFPALPPGTDSFDLYVPPTSFEAVPVKAQ